MSTQTVTVAGAGGMLGGAHRRAPFGGNRTPGYG